MMTMTINRLVRLIARPAMQALVYAALISTSGWSYAQSDKDEPTWYQVEVVIFERLSGNQGPDKETWPKDVALAYPTNWQKLITPEQAQNLAPLLEPNAATTMASSSAYDLAAWGDAPPVYRAAEKPEFAFVHLPQSARTLNESTGAVDRNRIMRVLFHEAWRQPIVAAEEAPAIIINGGNRYERHQELEGTISLSISRYLHVHTNLWFTQFIPNYGQESEHWPALPPIPERREQLPEATASTVDFTSKTSVWDLNSTLNSEYANLVDEPFLINEIFTLKQTRRMRSGELHYIDHPNMGMLIKIDPYKPDTE